MMEKLSWDSQFFNKNVFRLFSSDLNEVREAYESLDENSFLYVFSKKEIIDFESELVDRKVTYEINPKRLIENIEESSSISYDSGATFKKELIELSLSASRLSRFRVDKNVPLEKAEQMYRIWIEKSLDNPNNHDVMCYLVDGNLAGMLILSDQNTHCSIELVSVHPNYGRRGIGSKLVREAIRRSSFLNKESLTVVTQDNNLEACGLYEKNGFSIQKLEFIYHLHK